MKRVAPGEVALWLDGVAAGGAAWTWEELTWGRERVKVACLTRFEADADQDRAALRAYLDYLWRDQEAAAAVRETDGRLSWYSKALERSYLAAGEGKP